MLNADHTLKRMFINSALLGGTSTSEYRLTRLVLQRGIAAIYAIGFLVAINQFVPLLGAHGLTPVPYFVQGTNFASSPSIFYAHYSDAFAMGVVWIGLLLAVVAITGAT